jgi:hypothetical protein
MQIRAPRGFAHSRQRPTSEFGGCGVSIHRRPANHAGDDRYGWNGRLGRTRRRRCRRRRLYPIQPPSARHTKLRPSTRDSATWREREPATRNTRDPTIILRGSGLVVEIREVTPATLECSPKSQDPQARAPSRPSCVPGYNRAHPEPRFWSGIDIAWQGCLFTQGRRYPGLTRSGSLLPRGTPAARSVKCRLKQSSGGTLRELGESNRRATPPVTDASRYSRTYIPQVNDPERKFERRDRRDVR